MRNLWVFRPAENERPDPLFVVQGRLVAYENIVGFVEFWRWMNNEWWYQVRDLDDNAQLVPECALQYN